MDESILEGEKPDPVADVNYWRMQVMFASQEEARLAFAPDEEFDIEELWEAYRKGCAARESLINALEDYRGIINLSILFKALYE